MLNINYHGRPSCLFSKILCLTIAVEYQTMLVKGVRSDTLHSFDKMMIKRL